MTKNLFKLLIQGAISLSNRLAGTNYSYNEKTNVVSLEDKKQKADEKLIEIIVAGAIEAYNDTATASKFDV